MGKEHKSKWVRSIQIRTLKNDERGVVLLMTVMIIALLLLLAGLATDFARLYVAREELQTAVDAAALAGSRQGVRYVTITVGYGHCETCCGLDGCSCCCVCDPPVTLTGAEKKLVEEGGWRRGTCCDRFLGYEDRWIEYPANTTAVASSILNLNWPRFMSPEYGGSKLDSKIDVYSSGPYYPSVVARAAGMIKTTFLKLAGIQEINSSRCGQAGTFYSVIRNGWLLGKNSAPQDACW
ncbi:MAG: hypothetical protein PWR22_895 [Moorella sp. (in: firmicutes)]|nr:hypothetical protein [Moorella sp. (in: firmicutes)]